MFSLARFRILATFQSIQNDRQGSQQSGQRWPLAQKNYPFNHSIQPKHMFTIDTSLCHLCKLMTADAPSIVEDHWGGVNQLFALLEDKDRTVVSALKALHGGCPVCALVARELGCLPGDL
jgi:hypothetical protein